MTRTVLVLALFTGFAAPVVAGPISVFTQVRSVNGGSDELNLTGQGLGSWAVLTTGGGVGPVITVPADQTSAAAPVVGFWPVLGFRDRAHYESERGNVLTIPETPVKLYAEVWNGQYGTASDVRQVLIDAVISGTFGADLGQNSIDWKFVNPPVQVDFGQTTVTVAYVPVQMPDGLPQIQFEDGSAPIGFPGPQYYPTLLEARVEVQRDPNAPGDPPTTGEQPPGEQPPVTAPPGVPEPSSALLLAGLAFGGFVARVRAVRKS